MTTTTADRNFIEISTCPGKAFFFVSLVADLGVDGEMYRQMVCTGRSYEEAIMRAEKAARAAGVAVVDRVV
ncbi:hypothetical protein [Paracoccus haeundaensis]|uniref:Uncharacterized protein n=1 Tax=Paracoccus haeundaensis TaxID=225362 RepID=A0A5C4RBD9_9RHOB|nr:hypothetical protein [Paracoccus haeundaensis]TNH41290.1 hypothetical protein FHD67_00820 [Paracoccus haeundaensis]